MVVKDGRRYIYIYIYSRVISSFTIFKIYGTSVTIELLHMVILFFTFPKMFIDEIIVNPKGFGNSSNELEKWKFSITLHYYSLLSPFSSYL